MEEITQEKIDLFKTFLDTHSTFYIIGHKEPDGDCVASTLGLKEIVRHFKKKFLLLSAGPFKRTEVMRYKKFFSNEIPFTSHEEKKEIALIISDCSEVSRLGEIEGNFNNDLAKFDTFIIDHHKTALEEIETKKTKTADATSNDSDAPRKNETKIGSLCGSIIDPTAPAASLIVQKLYEKLIGVPPKKLANILFFGIMTDTGFYRFLKDNDADAIESTARLVHAGADPRQTYSYISSGKSFDSRKLLGLALSHAEEYLDGKLIITYETMLDTLTFGKFGRDSDMLYNALLSVRGVQAVVFIRQETETNCTLGFRSKNDLDVSVVAKKFGGGGHRNAAGGSATGTIDTLIPTVTKEMARVIFKTDKN